MHESVQGKVNHMNVGDMNAKFVDSLFSLLVLTCLRFFIYLVFFFTNVIFMIAVEEEAFICHIYSTV